MASLKSKAPSVALSPAGPDMQVFPDSAGPLGRRPGLCPLCQRGAPPPEWYVPLLFPGGSGGPSEAFANQRRCLSQMPRPVFSKSAPSLFLNSNGRVRCFVYVFIVGGPTRGSAASAEWHWVPFTQLYSPASPGLGSQWGLNKYLSEALVSCTLLNFYLHLFFLYVCLFFAFVY